MEQKISHSILALILILSFGLPLSAQISQDSLLPNVGHTSGVSSISGSIHADYAATMSRDGSVLIWDTQEGSLVDRVFVSASNPTFFEIHPNQSQFFFITRQGNSGYQLQAWNWEQHRLLFSKDLPELPLSISYSPSGDTIVATYPRWDSIELYNNLTGRTIRQMQNGFGIVDTAFISSSASNMLSYRSSTGKFLYHQIRTGSLLAEVSTSRSIENLTLFPNKRFALGTTGTTILVLDTVNGSTMSMLDVPRLSAAFPVTDTTIGIIINEDGRYFIRWVPVLNGQVQSTSLGLVRRIEDANGTFSLAGSNIVAGLTTGGISIVSSESTQSVQLKQSDPVQSFARAGGALFIGSPQGLFALSETEVLSKLSTGQAKQIRYKRIELPFSGGIPGLVSLEENNLLFWNMVNPSRIWRLDISDLEQISFTAVSNVFSKTIKRIGVESDHLLVFLSDGSLEVLNKENFSRVLSYSSLGLQDAIILNNDTLIIGKTFSSGFNSSLLSINLLTQETTTIPSQDRVIFDLLNVPDSSDYYALGISQSSDSQNTTLFRRLNNNSNFRSTIINRYPGEDSGGSLAYSNGSVISSAGFDQMLSWDGRRVLRYEKTRRLPRQIIPLSGYTSALNSDGTLSVWNAQTRQFYAELVILKSGEILILGDNKSIVISYPEGLDEQNIPVLTNNYLSTLVLLKNTQMTPVKDPEPELAPETNAIQSSSLSPVAPSSSDGLKETRNAPQPDTTIETIAPTESPDSNTNDESPEESPPTDVQNNEAIEGLENPESAENSEQINGQQSEASE